MLPAAAHRETGTRLRPPRCPSFPDCTGAARMWEIDLTKGHDVRRGPKSCAGADPGIEVHGGLLHAQNSVTATTPKRLSCLQPLLEARRFPFAVRAAWRCRTVG